jgi:hypothetical protein
MGKYVIQATSKNEGKFIYLKNFDLKTFDITWIRKKRESLIFETKEVPTVICKKVNDYSCFGENAEVVEIDTTKQMYIAKSKTIGMYLCGVAQFTQDINHSIKFDKKVKKVLQKLDTKNEMEFIKHY